MRLNAYLKYLVDTKVFRLVDLAKSADVYLSDLSRITNSKRACGHGTLTKLLKVLPVEHRAQFLMLWLQDQVPAEHRDLLHIVPVGPSNLSEESIDIGTFEGTMEFLRMVAGKNESLRQLLMFLATQHHP